MGKDEQGKCENPLSVPRGWNSQTVAKLRETEPKTDPLSLGIHWLRGSILRDHIHKVRDFLSIFFGSDDEELNYGLWLFDRSILWTMAGVRINYHSTIERYESTEGKISVEIPGFALESMTSWAVIQLLQGLRINFGFQCSRIDCYMDDNTRRITPKKIYDTVYGEDDDGNPVKRDFTGFQIIHAKSTGGICGRTYDEVAYGNRGSKGSGKYLRIYDKKLESEGKNNAVRWELELCEKKAKAAFAMLSNVQDKEDLFLSNLAAIMAGCISFVHRTDRAGDKNIKRLEVYEFWQSILSDLKVKCSLSTPVEKKTVERARDHIQKQCIGNLQLLRNAWGGEKFWDLLIKVVEEDDRMRKTHWAALNAYRAKMAKTDRVGPADIREFLENIGYE